MSLSFSLNLTPNQIEFLQALDLYADGLTGIPAAHGGGRDNFICWAKKLIREGLVEHVVPGPGQRHPHGGGCGEVVQAYRITDKGRQVLALVESDVKAFLERQERYRQAKENSKRPAAPPAPPAPPAPAPARKGR